jgi:GNAT superfamily N-acetyltransferase
MEAGGPRSCRRWSEYGCTDPRLPLAQQWRKRRDVAELRHLRVAPEQRGEGVGTRLGERALEWCRNQGLHALVCNATSAQVPALGLYRKLGFREVCRTYVGEYELVWSEVVL